MTIELRWVTPSEGTLESRIERRSLQYRHMLARTPSDDDSRWSDWIDVPLEVNLQGLHPALTRATSSTEPPLP